MNSNYSSKRSPLKFFILIFVLAIPFYVIGFYFGTLEGLPMEMSVSALMFPVPLIMALILVYRENGSEEVRKLLGRIVDYRRIKQKGWYVPIIFLMPIIFLASYVVMLLLRMPLPEPYIPILTIPILFAVFFISAAGED